MTIIFFILRKKVVILQAKNKDNAGVNRDIANRTIVAGGEKH